MLPASESTLPYGSYVYDATILPFESKNVDAHVTNQQVFQNTLITESLHWNHLLLHEVFKKKNALNHFDCGFMRRVLIFLDIYF